MTTNRNAVAETEYTPSRSVIERAWMMRRFQHDEDAGRDVNALVYSAEFRRWYESERRKWQAEALREAAGMIPEFPEPDNPYSYDPWDDDSVDPTNLEDVTGAAVDRGWSMGAFRAREEARRTILTRAAELENGEE